MSDSNKASLPTSATNADRRSQDRARVPHEALVAIEGASTGAFEAETVDVSATGMHLRTAYLPAIGTPLGFRFEPVDGSGPIHARGVVVWAQDSSEGREFGVRFEGLEASGADALRKIVSAAHEARAAGMKTDRAGTALRIHLEGVGSPMRATLRGTGDDAALVSSELRTLALGSAVELEDRELGQRRRARIEAVGCEIDGSTRIPQLIVRVRFEDATGARPHLNTEAFPLTTRASQAPSKPLESAMDMKADSKSDAKINADAPREAAAGPTSVQARVALPVSAEPIEDSVAPPKVVAAPVVNDDVDAEMGEEDDDTDRDAPRFGAASNGARKIGEKMKDVLEVGAARAMLWGARAKTTVELLGKRGRDTNEDAAAGETPRRQTSTVSAATPRARWMRPQSSKDVAGKAQGEGRAEGMEGKMIEQDEIEGAKIARRKQIGIAAGVGVALVLGALAFRKPHAAEAPPVAVVDPITASSIAAAPIPAPAPSVAPAPEPIPSALATTTLAGDPTGLDDKGNPKPFGTLSVKHGTRMLLKLDGPITELRGATTPTGFVVAVPNRKSTEAASPLAAKDPRIAAAKVVNQPGGAELTVIFKDASPSYIVKAKGDTLEIVLAHDKAIAKKGHGKDHAGTAKGSAAGAAKAPAAAHKPAK